MEVNIIKRTATTNTTAALGRSIRYIVWHYTAGTSSEKGAALNTADWFARSEAQASADYIVDDAEMVQYNPDPLNRYCWAVGGANYGNKGGSLYGTAQNGNCISIEICCNNSSGRITYSNDPRYTFSDAAVANALELTYYLMQKYGVDAEHVIRHYDVNGKPCPGIIGWNAESGDESKWKEIKKKLGGSVPAAEEKQYYRVRLAWNDAGSQLGAYEVLANAKKNCPARYTVYDWNGKAVYVKKTKGFQASALCGLTERQRISAVAPLYQEVAKETGMLASVGLAQFCRETGCGSTDLAQKVNNLHGMKCSLSGNTWAGSHWDGRTRYGKQSVEVYNGVSQLVYSEFRGYACCEDSVADRAAYFIGAKDGDKLRYPGINRLTNYKDQIHLIKAGGYATDPNYEAALIELVERYELWKYDEVTGDDTEPSVDPEPAAFAPYMVRVKIPDLRIRKDAGIDKGCVTENGKELCTGKGVFTVVKEKTGKVSSDGTIGTWGLLKSYSDKEDGWICLAFPAYTEKTE